MSRDRVQWMDLLRGVAIIFVLINHAILFAGGQPEGVPQEAATFNAIFAPLRMPLLVFLSGLMLASSLRKSTSAYIGGKLRGVAYPYVLWSLIVVGLDGATNIIDGAGIPWSDLTRMAYSPLAHLWFLFYLLGYYLIALLTRKISALVVVAAAFLACFILPDEWDRFFLLLGFFMLGKYASAAGDWAVAGRSRLVLALAVVFAVGLVAAATAGIDLKYSILSVPFVAAGIILSVQAAKRLQNDAWTAPLRSIGKVSVVYYLGHWYGAVAGAELAARLFDSGWATLTTSFVAGLLAGATFHLAYVKIPAGKLLFELPRPVRTTIP